MFLISFFAIISHLKRVVDDKQFKYMYIRNTNEYLEEFDHFTPEATFSKTL